MSAPRPHHRLWAAAIAFAITAAAPSAHAFCRSTTCVGECNRDSEGCKTKGEDLFWPSSCVSFSLNEDGSEHIPFAIFEDIAVKSFVSWSDLDCGTGFATLAFTREDDVECHTAEYNQDGPNANIIMFQDTKWDYTDVSNTLAKTTVTYDTETGEIFDADIELNHAYNEFTTIDDGDIEYDLQSILTHEIGHFLGLDHTQEFGATMNAGYQPGSIDQRTLEPDDIAGACAIYDPDRDAVCSPSPKGGFTEECAVDLEEPGCAACEVGGRPPPELPWPLTIVALGWLARRRRKSG